MLSPLREGGAEQLSGLLDEPQLRQWLRANDLPELRARFKAWESGSSPDGREQWLNWVVSSREDGRAVGWVQATVRGALVVVAYAVLPSERGHGIATEALQALDPLAA